MGKSSSALRALLACGYFGAACGAAMGAAFGGLSMLLSCLLAMGRFSLGEFALVLLLAVGLGLGCGFCLGALGGLMAGTLGGSVGGVAGWALGGLFGGYQAGLIPSTWIPWPIETIGAVIGLAAGGGVGTAFCVGESALDPLNRLIALVDRSELTVWPTWKRVALGVALLLVWSVVAGALYRWVSLPFLPGSSLLRRL